MTNVFNDISSTVERHIIALKSIQDILVTAVYFSIIGQPVLVWSSDVNQVSANGATANRYDNNPNDLKDFSLATAAYCGKQPMVIDSNVQNWLLEAKQWACISDNELIVRHCNVRMQLKTFNEKVHMANSRSIEELQESNLNLI